VPGQVEVLSLLGNITLADGQPKVHAHAVVGLPDGSTRGGHVLEAHVWPTLEIFLVESGEPLHRARDPETGLDVIHL
jgi:predicted DNA-binding protein with PD1-like motif